MGWPRDAGDATHSGSAVGPKNVPAASEGAGVPLAGCMGHFGLPMTARRGVVALYGAPMWHLIESPTTKRVKKQPFFSKKISNECHETQNVGGQRDSEKIAQNKSFFPSRANDICQKWGKSQLHPCSLPP